MHNWSYAEKSHWFKINGGPEEALRKLSEREFLRGFNAGKKSFLTKSILMIPIIYFAGFETKCLLDNAKIHEIKQILNPINEKNLKSDSATEHNEQNA